MSTLLDKYKNDEPISFDTYKEEKLCNLTFKLASIEEIVFEQCKMEHVVFRDLYMGKVTFKNCELLNCYFMNVCGSYLTILDSKLTDVVFDDSKIRYFEANDSLFQFCSFSKMKLQDAKINSRILSTTFENMELNTCDFKSSFFDDLKVMHLDCEDVSFCHSKFISIKGDMTSFKGATLSMEQALDIVMGMGIIIKEFE